MRVAEAIQKAVSLDEVWFIVSPQNPFKKIQDLAPESTRFRWVEKVVHTHKGWKALDIKFSMARPSYTIFTVEKLMKEFPQHNFRLLMGADNLASFHQWKDHERLSMLTPLLVYARMGYAEPGQLPPGAQYFNFPLLEISATAIRTALHHGVSLDTWIPSEILEDVKAFFS